MIQYKKDLSKPRHGADMAPKPTFLSRKKSDPQGTSSGAASSKAAADPEPPIITEAAEDIPIAKRQKKHGPKSVGVKLPQKDQSDVFKHFGSMAESVVGKEEFATWENKSEEERDNWMAKDTLEMFYHNFERETAKDVLASRLSKVEKDNSRLKNEVIMLSNDNKDLRDEKSTMTTELPRLQSILDEKEKEMHTLKDSVKELIEEAEKLKYEEHWRANIEAEKDISFEEGCNSYCALFLAGYPDFDWTAHFGKSMAAFMKEFQEKEEELIGEKKKELEKTLAEEEKARQPSPLARQPSHLASMDVDESNRITWGEDDVA